MNIFVHCWRDAAGVHAPRVGVTFGGAQPGPLVTSDLTHTLEVLRAPFLLFAHEASTEQWEALYRAVEQQQQDRTDWAVIRFSLEGSDELADFVPKHRHLAVLRSRLQVLLDHLEHSDREQSVEAFCTSICSGNPQFAHLCRRAPNLRDNRDIDALFLWLASAEEARDAGMHDAELDAYLQQQRPRAEKTLAWLVETFGPAGASCPLTAESASRWLKLAQSHPQLHYLD